MTTFSYLKRLMNEGAILGWNWQMSTEELQIQSNNGTIIKFKIKNIEVVREGFPK